MTTESGFFNATVEKAFNELVFPRRSGGKLAFLRSNRNAGRHTGGDDGCSTKARRAGGQSRKRELTI